MPVIKDSNGFIVDAEQVVGFYEQSTKILTYNVQPLSNATVTSSNPDITAAVNWESSTVNIVLTCLAEKAEGTVTLTCTGDNQSTSINIRVKKIPDFGFLSGADKAKMDFIFSRGLYVVTKPDTDDEGVWVGWEVPD